ncbi:MAG: hypothetical protein C5B50_22770 [Verrucomicrobia bacterium]|nr:MAG: hypothetical protein C5B50_22770 [Verrucomicrobiota bacterium]
MRPDTVSCASCWHGEVWRQRDTAHPAARQAGTSNVPNCGIFEEAHQHFNEKELADLTLAVVAINGWNRLSIALRNTPGSYHAADWEKFLKAA